MKKYAYTALLPILFGTVSLSYAMEEKGGEDKYTVKVLQKLFNDSQENKESSIIEQKNIQESLENFNIDHLKRAQTSLHTKKKKSKYAAILSCDGGGFRGLMQAYWFDHLERVTNRPLYKII